MPGEDQTAFSLTTSYIPGGQTNRNVMTGFLAASGDAGNERGVKGEGYGKLSLLELPRDLTVPGPGQAQNTMLANPKVSTDLNLLQQGGTEIMRGNLLSLPVGDGLLYVQPVYVQASSGTQYPTLQYVLTLFGDNVGFAPTLDESLDQVFGGDSGVNAGDAGVVGEKEAPLEGATPPEEPSTEPTEDPRSEPSQAPIAPVPGSVQERLDSALNSAKKAIEDSKAALDAGNWADYGKAQEALEKAIDDAVKAQQEIDGQ